MEEVIKILSGSIKAPWSYVLAALALGMALVPRVSDAHRQWVDFRTDRWRIALERERLELTKLAVEIEILRKTNGIEVIPVLARSEAKESERGAALPAWLASLREKSPLAARAVALSTPVFFMLGSVVAGFFLACIAFASMMGAFKAGDVSGVVLSVSFFALIGLGCFSMYRQSRTWFVSFARQKPRRL